MILYNILILYRKLKVSTLTIGVIPKIILINHMKKPTLSNKKINKEESKKRASLELKLKSLRECKRMLTTS